MDAAAADTATTTRDGGDARTPPTPEELSEAVGVEVYDREGKTVALGDLVKGKRSILVFTRHFCKST